MACSYLLSALKTKMQNIRDYPVLRRPRQKFGIGQKPATVIWAGAAIGTFSAGFPWALGVVLVALLIHVGMMWAFRFDSKIIEMYTDYQASPDVLHAGLDCQHSVNLSRPKGWGRNISC